MRKGGGMVVASVAAVLLGTAVMSLRWKRTADFLRRWKMQETLPLPEMLKRVVSEGVLGAIRNAPRIRIRSLLDGTSCEIYGEAEFLNPGGSLEDRVAAKIVGEYESFRILRQFAVKWKLQ